MTVQPAVPLSLAEFERLLLEMEPGKYASLNDAAFDALFPPGEPDEDARERAYFFAKQAGCRIENRRDLGEVWFVKDAPRRN